MSGSDVLEKPTGELYESSRMFVWKILTSDYLEGRELVSPKFSTTVGNVISNWHLRCKEEEKNQSSSKRKRTRERSMSPSYSPYYSPERQQKCTSIFLHHNGQADIYAEIKFVVLDRDGEEQYENLSRKREKIFKTHMTGVHFHKITDITSDTFLHIGCEIKFDPSNYYDLQLQQTTLPLYQRLREFDKFEKLLNEPRFADVSLHVQTNDNREPLLAHRSILSALSPVFEAMFAHEMLENKRSRVGIKDIAYDVMKELLRYLYTAKISENVDLNMVGDLLMAADKYNVEGLKTRCEKLLGDGLTIANALRLLSLADTHNARELRANSINFIVTNSVKIIDSEEFKLYGKLQPDVICEIFRALVNYKMVTK